jgi:uncharacterized protein YdaU (DUF1376 family)
MNKYRVRNGAATQNQRAMRRLAWMPMYWGDYLGDTGHLTTTEHGVYLLLIAHYWMHRGLPTDDRQLRRIAKISSHQWKKIREVIAPYFSADWKHKRIEQELANATAIGTANSEKAQKAALERWLREKAQSNAPSNAPSTPKTDPPPMLGAMLQHAQPPSHTDSSSFLSKPRAREGDPSGTTETPKTNGSAPAAAPPERPRRITSGSSTWGTDTLRSSPLVQAELARQGITAKSS